ncbi:hypothetical protein FOL47_011283 [Perkinsus chesapeaki]|uniref:Uncharacterized protein n=1 Tax=Perkinsus chesapeaki TaxID=330153 RepID=A0A7J6MMX8_PERCH|nr:hypothetical protein FOL47_011283 [Perkinsus chesapeaki]
MTFSDGFNIHGAFLGSNGMEIRNTILKMLKETPGGAAGRELFSFFDGIEHENWMLKAKLERLSSSGEGLVNSLKDAEERANSLQSQLEKIVNKELETIETQTEPLKRRGSEIEAILKERIEGIEGQLAEEREKAVRLTDEIERLQKELKSAASERREQKSAAELNKELAKAQQGADELRRRIGRMERTIEEEKEKAKRMEEEYRTMVEGMRGEIEKASGRMRELEEENHFNTRLIEDFRRQNGGAAVEAEEARRAAISLQEENAGLSEQLEMVKRELEEERGFRSRVAELEREAEESLRREAEMGRRVEEVEERLREREEENARLKSAFDDLKDTSKVGEENWDRVVQLMEENDKLEAELAKVRSDLIVAVEASASQEELETPEVAETRPVMVDKTVQAAFSEKLVTAPRNGETREAVTADKATTRQVREDVSRVGKTPSTVAETRGEASRRMSTRRTSTRSCEEEARRELANAQAQIRNYKYEVERLTAALEHLEEAVRSGKTEKIRLGRFVSPRTRGASNVWMRLYLDAREREERRLVSQKESREQFSEWWFLSHHSSDEDSDGYMSEWSRGAAAGLAEGSPRGRKMRKNRTKFRSRLKSPRSPKVVRPPSLPDASTCGERSLRHILESLQSSTSVFEPLDSFILTPMNRGVQEDCKRFPERCPGR